MATSQELLNQMQQYSSGNIPGEIETAIKKAYEPTVSSLINEGNALRPKAYTGFFDAAQKYGTGAGDMSPAARLSAMIGQGELAMQPYRNNMDIRNYYGTSINDMVNKGLQAYQTGYGNLKDMYGAVFQREQADRDEAFRQQQLAEQRSARAAQENAAAQQAQMLRDYYNKGWVDTNGDGIPDTPPSTPITPTTLAISPKAGLSAGTGLVQKGNMYQSAINNTVVNRIPDPVRRAIALSPTTAMSDLPAYAKSVGSLFDRFF